MDLDPRYLDVTRDFDGDRIILRDLGFFGYHGVMPEEAVLGQRFFIDLVCGADLAEAGRSDELQHSISGELNDARLGQEEEVLVESRGRRDEAQLYGKSRDFKTVVFADDGTPQGSLRRVRVVGATPVTLVAESVETRREGALVAIG